MAKREVVTARPSVSDLLAAKAQAKRTTLTAEQAEQVRIAIEHNDRALAMQDRISSLRVWRLLREHYGFTGSREALDRATCDLLGRTSWGAK